MRNYIYPTNIIQLVTLLRKKYLKINVRDGQFDINTID